MSRLFATDHGRIINALGEELTRWRWAKKELRLPAAAAGAPAELWIFVHAYPGSRQPLHVQLNGKKIGDITPPTPRHNGWLWLSLRVPRGRLRAGVNTITLHSDGDAMNSWALGLEPGKPNPHNSVSHDAGKTWRRDAMGLFNLLSGQYIVRLRVEAPSLHDPKLPAVVYENPKHPRVKSLPAALPASIRNQRDPWRQVLDLQAWVSNAWTYRGGTLYTPWDPLTILDWGRHDRGHGWKGPIGFCVHYGTAMVGLAGALGHKARCVAVSGNLNTHMGHFMTEVWSDRHDKWVLHDPTVDAHFEYGGRPLSLWELTDLRHAGLMPRVTPRTGRAHREPHKSNLRNFIADCRVLDLAGVWLRNDFVSDPTAAASSHGHVIYCETEWVWYLTAGRPEGARSAAMFPHRTGDRAYFDAPPRG
ncbi:MAG: transglutaminase-like domain-containing protein [Planctomycetes bacterium]|nr:transglutaminase-like domain-containing protein [Planctomycetota bacterium]